MTEPARPLPAAEIDTARTALRDDITAITTVQERVVEFDHGERRTFTAPPLLTQLEHDVHGGTGPQGSFSPRSKPPTGIDALTLLDEIDRLAGRPTTDHGRATRVFDWGMSVSSSTPGAITDHARTAARWRSAIEALLDPPPRFRVRGQACPSCGAQKVWDRVDHAAGEHHARPALEVNPDTGDTVCSCCSATWPPEMHELLAQVLEQQRRETLAHTSHADPTVRARTGAEAGLRWYDDPDPTRPGHAPDLSSTDPAVVQCPARVAHPDPTRFRRRQRCSSLLDVHGQCPNADAHEWEPTLVADSEDDDYYPDPC